jgi:hypothetical protein
MLPALLLLLLRRQPFRPFRVYLSSGLFHEVPHPELAAVGATILVLRFPASLHTPVPIGSRETIIALNQIVQLETVERLNPALN